MKSFLIDALRQADGQIGDDGTEKPRADAADDSLLTTDELGYSNATELSLLEIQEEPVDESCRQSDTADTPNQFDRVASAYVGPGALLSATKRLTARSTALPSQESIFARLGRLTPLLCLVAMSAAAGGYMLLNRIAFNNLNQDLSDLSERFRSDSRTAVEQDGWRNLPVTDISVINEIVARNADSVAPAPIDTANPIVPVGQASATPARSRRADRNIGIGVTKNVASIVNDRAYSSVLAAFKAYRARNYELAEKYYLRALEIEPHHLDALAGLAAVFRQTGREQRAAETYQKLLGMDPGNTVAASAIISLRSKDADWATESDLKHLLQQFPEAHHLHFALGSYFVEQGRWVDARHEFLAAHRLAPRYADYSFNVAVSMENLGEYSEARSYFEMALATAEDSSNIDMDAVTQHLNEMTAHLRERL